MVIVKLLAENIKRLKAVRIEPDGNVVKITGKNGAGKSSVLDAIWWGLGGERAIQAVPIRKGEEKARVRLDLGDLVVERKFTSAGTYLRVAAKDGAVYPSPQKMLDRLIAKLAFDPLAFLGESGAKQLQTLKDLAGVDTDELDRDIQEAFDQRTDLSRDAKAAASVAIDARNVAPDEKPEEPASTVDLVGKLQEARSRKEENDRIRAEHEGRMRDVVLAEERVEELQRQLTASEEFLDQRKLLARKATEAVEAIVNPDVAGIEEEIAGADAAATSFRLWNEAEKAEAEARELSAKAKTLSDRIEDLRALRETKIRESNLPVEGLSFGVDGVLFRGLPLDQASHAEQLRVSLGMAMAMNPDLRVVRITDGSLLDSDSFAVVEEMAREKEFQVWVEVVGEDGEGAILVEDGEVVEVASGPSDEDLET